MCDHCGVYEDDADDETVVTLTDDALGDEEEYRICSLCAILLRDTWFPHATDVAKAREES